MSSVLKKAYKLNLSLSLSVFIGAKHDYLFACYSKLSDKQALS